MTQDLDLLRAAAHEGDAIDLGQIGGGHRVVGGGPAGLAVVVLTIRHQRDLAAAAVPYSNNSFLLLSILYHRKCNL